MFYVLIKKSGLMKIVYRMLPEPGKDYVDKMKSKMDRKLQIDNWIKNGYPKLNLGSGNDWRTDYINIDKYNQADIKADICSSLKCRSESISEILMSHVLDHLPRKSVQPLLKECHRVLRKGGKLEVIVQNSEIYQKEWLEGSTDYKRGWGVINIYGHDEEGAYHRNAFTEEILEIELRDAGFSNHKCYVTETRPYTKINNHFEYRKDGDIKGIGIKE